MYVYNKSGHLFKSNIVLILTGLLDYVIITIWALSVFARARGRLRAAATAQNARLFT